MVDKVECANGRGRGQLVSNVFEMGQRRMDKLEKVVGGL
jgi:hypothetical protein